MEELYLNSFMFNKMSIGPSSFSMKQILVSWEEIKTTNEPASYLFREFLERRDT